MFGHTSAHVGTSIEWTSDDRTCVLRGNILSLYLTEGEGDTITIMIPPESLAAIYALASHTIARLSAR